MENIGFVGLGIMGSRIVPRLLAAGYTVCGYNRTRSKAEKAIEAGMQWRDTPREVAYRLSQPFGVIKFRVCTPVVSDPARVRPKRVVEIRFGRQLAFQPAAKPLVLSKETEFGGSPANWGTPVVRSFCRFPRQNTL